MITIIAGTNRPNSNTLKVATHYYNLLKESAEEVHLFSLQEVAVHYRSDDFIAIERDWLIPSDKFIFVLPEYNGSFPGILKTMMDNSDIKKCWWHKKALLVGLADGRGGNARGLDHLSNILHYLKMHVHYNKLPISKINEELLEDGSFKHEATQISIQQQVQSFLDF
ncbi:NADPH-dependent FMN reductase [Taibaiella sp. KBW10]|uniref:NADPH-dependent FMN reductase n=1 Tax=Taibaiella sp. KBW10 TaxID=2153357 RepID=UPI000F5B10E4|nr:NAD(P)H-dependent oxidoreductase [Taibaiella sp. KBW10]RQO31739.1 NADPH-dependent FMN reductase [Taibaiella sp. KBW10]